MQKDIKGNGDDSMTNFNEWYKNIEKEYPLYQDKDGYNIGNMRALKVGWKAALEWIIDNYPDDATYEIVKKELREE